VNYPRPEQRKGTAGFAAIVDRVATMVGLARGLSKQDSFAIVEAFGEELFTTLRRKKRVNWPGRGTFRVTKRKARDVTNPQTRETMRLPASIGIGFRAAKAEKERLREPL
jgi:DNA-binding protein HU-beta